MLIQRLTESIPPNISNKEPHGVPYKAVANLCPTKYSWPPYEEKYCVIIPIKIRNSDSVVDHYVFSPTVK